jgi:sRNA-binding regulator protein Hfq
MDLYKFTMIYKHSIDHFEHKNVVILALACQNYAH